MRAWCKGRPGATEGPHNHLGKVDHKLVENLTNREQKKRECEKWKRQELEDAQSWVCMVNANNHNCKKGNICKDCKKLMDKQKSK
eukprot:SAG31_NODE_803_length_12003_cov_25.248593_4_plen_85_part_00